MRATMTRITWLLLSLSCICPHGSNQTATSVTKISAATTALPLTVLTGGSISVTEPTTGLTAAVTTVAPPTGDAGKKNNPTQAPTPVKPTAVVTTAVTTAVTTTTTTVAATSKPADKPTTTQPQAPTDTKKPPAPPASITNAPPTVRNDATLPAAASTPPAAVTPAATTAGNRGSVVSPNAATVQTPTASEPSKTSRTDAPGNMGTTKVTKVTDAATLNHVTSTTKTSKGGTKETTVTMTMSSRTPEPAGSTRPPSTTKAGPPPAETFSTTAGTTSPQTTSITSRTISRTTTQTSSITAAQAKTFQYSLNSAHEEEDQKDLVEVCRRLMVNLQDGNCSLTWRHHNGKLKFDCVEINGKVKTSLAAQYYEEITKKPSDNKTLIAILASCGALLIMIVILAVCASHHRKPYHENQQHLTEELHTVENGYHDNPTLEVMEVQPEMQEKKMNGEFNDSWIVPIDNLLKEDVVDEEDTHL